MAENNFIKKVTLDRISEPGAPYEPAPEYCSPNTLKRLKKSPLHFLEEQRKESASLDFGTLYHTYVLEPEVFNSRYFVLDKEELEEETRKAYMAQGQSKTDVVGTQLYTQLLMHKMKSNKGAQPISKADFDKIKAMRKRLLSHPYIAELLGGGVKESMHYCTVELEDGKQIKVRFIPDNLQATKYRIVDLKSAQDASLEGFKRAAAKYGYHIQGALSVDLAEQIYSPGVPFSFIFIVQESTPPYAFNIFKASQQFLAQGRYEYELLMLLWHECITTGEYPGLEIWAEDAKGVQELDLPGYAIKSLDWNINKK